MSDLDRLDDMNRGLLRELHAEPRISMSALARTVGMSAPAVTERVHAWSATGSSPASTWTSTPPPSGSPCPPSSGSVPPRASSRRSPTWPLPRPGQRVPPDHRRGLLPIKVHAATIPESREGPRPVPHPRADRLLDRGDHTGAAEAAADPRVGTDDGCGAARQAEEAAVMRTRPAARGRRHPGRRRRPLQGLLRRPRLAAGRRLPLRQRLPRRPAHPAGLAVLGAVRHRDHDGGARHRPGALPGRLRHRGGPRRARRPRCRRQRRVPPRAARRSVLHRRGGRAAGPARRRRRATARSPPSTTPTATAGCSRRSRPGCRAGSTRQTSFPSVARPGAGAAPGRGRPRGARGPRRRRVRRELAGLVRRRTWSPSRPAPSCPPETNALWRQSPAA